MAPKAGSSQWEHKSDKDLLLVIIDSGALKSIDWKLISERMAAKGYTFSHEACRQHFMKIRKEARTGSADSTESTPRKPRAGNSTPRKRSKVSSYEESQVTDDDEDLTPAKRAKIKAEGKVKSEGLGGLSAPLFKIEKTEGKAVVDLENDDLYDEDAYA